MGWLSRGAKGVLHFKGLNFGFECKKVKYLRLKFSPQGEFSLCVPYGYTEKMLFEFLQKNEKWIERKRAEFEKKYLLNAGKIEFLGKFYELKFDERVKRAFFATSEFDENTLDKNAGGKECAQKMPSKNARGDEFDESLFAAISHDENAFEKPCEKEFAEFLLDESELNENEVAKKLEDKTALFVQGEAQLKEFLRDNARKICLFYVKKWQEHFAGRISRVSVKMMKTRWGSCNSKKGYINLSTRLIHKPFGAIEYVILHELTHLKFPHHQPSFYAHIAGLMPDYKARERLLK